MKNHSIDRNHIPVPLFEFASHFQAAGKELYLVGGSVRDILLHDGLPEETGDFDFATNAFPQEVQKIFTRTIPTGIQHGTVTVLFQGNSFEVTTYRADGVYSDGRRPDEVAFSDTIEEDLKRRDFTVNALALSLETMKVLDLYGGIDDLAKGIVRAVGDPVVRFQEDGLRPLRACRFAAKLGFEIEPDTLSAIGKTLDVFKKVALERVHDELYKMMRAEKPSLGIEYMRQSGLLAIVLPELLEGYQVVQNEYHKYDVYYHNLHSCDAAPADQPLIRFAALLHDIGKVKAMRQAEKWQQEAEGPVFYNHEVIGARMADRILRRLKFSNADREKIVHLIKHHMFYYTEEWTDGAVRRLMRNIGVDMMDQLFTLRQADRAGNGKKQGPSKSLEKLKRRMDKIVEAENAITVKDLKINGRDLMSHFSLRPGRIIGDILEHLLEIILDDPQANEPELLLELAKQFLEKKE